jgi:hypothetical protein
MRRDRQCTQCEGRERAPPGLAAMTPWEPRGRLRFIRLMAASWHCWTGPDPACLRRLRSPAFTPCRVNPAWGIAPAAAIGDYFGLMLLQSLLDLPDEDEPLIEGEDEDDGDHGKRFWWSCVSWPRKLRSWGVAPPILMAEAV